MEMEKFKDNLIHLRVIIEEIEKINITERLETKKKKKEIRKKELNELEMIKTDQLAEIERK